MEDDVRNLESKLAQVTNDDQKQQINDIYRRKQEKIKKAKLKKEAKKRAKLQQKN